MCDLQDVHTHTHTGTRTHARTHTPSAWIIEFNMASRDRRATNGDDSTSTSSSGSSSAAASNVSCSSPSTPGSVGSLCYPTPPASPTVNGNQPFTPTKLTGIGPKYKLISSGDIILCRLNETRTIVSKIMNSKYLRRWESHHLILGDTDIQSATVWHDLFLF